MMKLYPCNVFHPTCTGCISIPGRMIINPMEIMSFRKFAQQTGNYSESKEKLMDFRLCPLFGCFRGNDIDIFLILRTLAPKLICPRLYRHLEQYSEFFRLITVYFDSFPLAIRNDKQQKMRYNRRHENYFAIKTRQIGMG